MRKHLFYLSMVLVLTLFSACGGGKKGLFTCLVRLQVVVRMKSW